MDRTPAPVSLATARGLQPPEGSRAAEVFRDDHVWIRFAARPTSGPQVPHDRDEFYIVASGTALSLGRRRNHDRTGRHDVRGGAYAARLRPILGRLLGLGGVLRAAKVCGKTLTDDGGTLPVASDAPGRVSPIVGPTDPRGGSAEQLPADQPIGFTAAQQALMKIPRVWAQRKARFGIQSPPSKSRRGDRRPLSV